MNVQKHLTKMKGMNMKFTIDSLVFALLHMKAE